MPMIWTDADGTVRRTHYQPDRLDPEERDGILVDSVPQPDPPEPYCGAELAYDADTDSLSYEYTDPYTQFDVSLTETQKREIYRVVREGDFQGAVELVGGAV